MKTIICTMVLSALAGLLLATPAAADDYGRMQDEHSYAQSYGFSFDDACRAGLSTDDANARALKGSVAERKLVSRHGEAMAQAMDYTMGYLSDCSTVSRR